MLEVELAWLVFKHVRRLEGVAHHMRARCLVLPQPHRPHTY